ncbi:MAG: hypothetical protein WB723_15385 [Candidatus Acidiferrales bacterium]
MLLAVLFASPALAQNAPTDPLMAAGCGANDVRFDVKTDKKQHPTGQPEAGRALVYVIGDSFCDHESFHIGTLPTRFGVDGTWVGANGYRSYFFFLVEPGEHRLCTNMQSKLQRQVKSSTAATSFTAEAGKSYYFKTRTPDRPVANEEVKLVPVDPAEAQVLLANAAFSIFSVKK